MDFYLTLYVQIDPNTNGVLTLVQCSADCIKINWMDHILQTISQMFFIVLAGPVTDCQVRLIYIFFFPLHNTFFDWCVLYSEATSSSENTAIRFYAYNKKRILWRKKGNMLLCLQCRNIVTPASWYVSSPNSCQYTSLFIHSNFQKCTYVHTAISNTESNLVLMHFSLWR